MAKGDELEMNKQMTDELRDFYRRGPLNERKTVYEILRGRPTNEILREKTNIENAPNALPMLPPKPAGFRYGQLIGGSPTFARAARKMLDLSPYANRNIERVTVGPTPGTMRSMHNAGLNMSEFEDTNLLGQYDWGKNPQTDEIAINPKYPEEYQMNILAHEIAHGANYPDAGRTNAETASKIFGMYPLNRRKQ